MPCAIMFEELESHDVTKPWQLKLHISNRPKDPRGSP
jgi:hypothetical protein